MYARGNINNQITTVLVISYHFTCLKYRPPMSNINSMCGLCIQYQVIPETQEFGIFHQFDTSPETNNESCDNLGGVKKNSTKHILQLINLSLSLRLLSLSLLTWEVVKGSGGVFGGVPVRGVADHKASFPHSPIPHQHTLDPNRLRVLSTLRR